MRSGYLHNNCCFEAEKKLIALVKTNFCIFHLVFLIGFNFITKYAFYSKLRFEWNLWGIQGFHEYEMVSAACRFVVKTKK